MGLRDFTNMKTPPKPPTDPLESMKAPLKPPPIDPKEAIKGHQAGDGIRSMETSSVFRTLNFELYVKPNKYFMAFGITAISCCIGYLAYMKINTESKDFTQQLM